ncbi:MAG: hypothetical protein HY369_00005, partial [Candidatus Aenigmarchaeota archaeon]|nr:hypothetical protein [Candidatus Aenigmarchaeota archaeon]
ATSANATHHFLTLNQNLSNSQVFLVFTKGDQATVANRIPLIEAGTFLREISPSFAYPLGGPSPIMLLLRYPDIDLRGNLAFRQGTHEITLTSNSTGGSKIVLVNETVAA